MEQTPLFTSWKSAPTSAREKNLVALMILVAGLFVGSLAVDAGQLITGSGFSQHALQGQNIVTIAGKTWVAYAEPRVSLKVVTDRECEECNPDEALTWLRRIVPTVDAERVDANTFDGKKLITDYELRTLPAFIFDKTVSKTDFYSQAGPLFTEKGGHYVFDMAKIGLPIGKYLTRPPIDVGDATLGSQEAPVRFTIWSDFDCEYCRAYHTVVKHLLADYGEKIFVVFKQLPLPTHPQSENAAEAALCAHEQGKYLEYADLLFSKKSDWNKSKSTQKFKNYSTQIRGMNSLKFISCLDEKKFASTLEADQKTAEEYAVTAAPASFLNTEYIAGAAPYPDVKDLLEKVLGAD